MKRLLTLLLMFFALTNVQAQETPADENKCGDNLYWSYDGATRTLTISGDGPMYDYGTAPWREYNIKKVEFIGIPTSIGKKAFQHTDIESIEIPEGVTSIGSFAFFACKELESVKIPLGVTSLEGTEFSDCSSLVTVELPEGLKKIGSRSFYNCTSLVEINIPSTVEIIDNAFGGCSALESIVIPESVTSIDYSAFGDCTALESIRIPANVAFIKDNAFRGCTGLTSIIVDEKNTVYDSRGNCNAIIETATNTLMIGCKNTIIPDDATALGYMAFQHCSSLTSIRIPASVTKIANDAFHCCSSLTSIVIDEGNTVYDSRDNCNAIIETATNTLIKGCNSTIIPDGITSIYNDAFYACNALESVVIPAGVTSIGSSVFGDCTALKSIVIPESVTEIGQSAFYGCSALTSIEIPDSVTILNNFLFDGCSSLTSIRIPDNVTSIGTQAFRNCKLTSIVIPASVTKIGGSAFRGCYALTSVISLIPADKLFSCSTSFPIAVTDTSPLYVVPGAKSAYENTNQWSRFKKIVEIDGECGDELHWSLNDSGILTIMGNGAMHDYTSSRAPWYDIRDSIRVVRFLSNVTSIDSEAFRGCNGIESIVSFIPADKLFAPGTNAFADVDKNSCRLYVLADTKSKHETIAGWKEFSNIIEINGECGDRLYWSLDEATGTLTILGDGTMVDNSYSGVSWYSSHDRIKTVNFIGCPTNIGNYAFYDCSALTSIVIPEGVTSIGEYAFSQCSALESIVIPEGLTEICNSAFSRCTALASLEIPASVTSIGDYAFYICGAIQNIVVDEGNTVYDSRGNCNAIIETATNKLIAGSSNTVIPDDITVIGDAAFYECSGLTNIKIPASVTSIGRNAFYGCGGLMSIVVDDGNTVYDSRTNCNAIIETATNTLIKGSNNTIIPYGVTNIAIGAFYNCDSLTYIDIPGSVTNIGTEAFMDCGSLAIIEIPEGVTNIGGGAFKDCISLTSVVIPSTVTSIGNFAFESCIALTSIVSHIAAEDLFSPGEYVFDNVDKYACTLYVPNGAKAAYAAADQWRDFMNIVESGATDIDNVVSEVSFDVPVYYDLSGRRVENPAGGIYIVNGKKVYIK